MTMFGTVGIGSVSDKAIMEKSETHKVLSSQSALSQYRSEALASVTC